MKMHIEVLRPAAATISPSGGSKSVLGLACVTKGDAMSSIQQEDSFTRPWTGYLHVLNSYNLLNNELKVRLTAFIT